ncbi:MAG: phosphoadenosine phosphosulfate reductase family protein [Selenomonadaceae bacterium]|nr:phosphoadenosine phosphosulfate reductase family protein [Selenomonadaceae bacterium]
MALKKIYGTQNVLEAARQRIRNIFANGLPVYLSFSSGKDSLCLAHLTYDLILRGEISAKQLTVMFIDEEGLYPSMLAAAFRWRDNFLRLGAKFEWYCLEVKQVCVIDNLSATESWITWEKNKRAVWMREPPPFAITEHPLVPYAGYCNYQTFCINRTRDGIQMIGIRATESIQRLKAIAFIKLERREKYPIYDWKDSDVWLYIKENNLEFPEAYIRLYEAGVPKARLRLCNFFGDSSIQGLKWVAETDPELWSKIERRYPNAYLVLLYWDSEMFKRQSRRRTQMEVDEEQQDYKAKLYDLLFVSTQNYPIPSDTFKLLKNWRRMIIALGAYMSANHYKRSYEAILSGDPKGRTYRAVYTQIFCEFTNQSRKEQARRDQR